MGWITITYVTEKEIRQIHYGDDDPLAVDNESCPLHPTRWESQRGRPIGGHTPEENGE